MRIPIVVKLMSVTALLLLGASFLIAYNSSKEIAEDSLKSQGQANSDYAQSLANEVNNILTNAKEKIFSLGTLALKAAIEKTDDAQETLDLSFIKSKEIIALDLYEYQNGKFVLMKRLVNDEKLKESGFQSNYIETLRAAQRFPLHPLAKGQVEIQNSSIPRGIPLITIGMPLSIDNNGQHAYVLVADIPSAKIQKAFSKPSPRVSFLVDKRGVLLAHKDEKRAINRDTFVDHPLIREAMTRDIPQKQISFRDPSYSKSFEGAFIKTAMDTIVVSQTAVDLILEPAENIKREIIWVTGMVLSSSLFLIFLFSTTLTSPIEQLAGLIKLVSKGNFNVSARKMVRSQDEVGDLAAAFDNMTEGLKERDKVKTLFNKFHGSSVAEEMMSGDVGMRGSSKNVTVFFSDVRGFTAFSEGHTPQEVVDMLNEYFAIMVRIINQNNGIVDKFIGDAIMAVWGAPKSTGDDAYWAVKAALEMRTALNDLNDRRKKRGQKPILIGMGIHSGSAISGTIGSEERMEYTVIGDTVNQTSRIESSTKAFGTDLLISDSTAKLVQSRFGLDFAGKAEVKGISEALKLYKVKGYFDSNKLIEIKTPYSDYAAEKADKVKVA